MSSDDDPSSVLYGINVQDVHSLKRVMSAIVLRLNNMPRENAHQMTSLTDAEGVVVERLLAEVAGSPLLRRMVDRFVSANAHGPQVVLRAAQEFVRDAIEAVRVPFARPQREWVLAQTMFDQGPQFYNGAAQGGTKRGRASELAATPSKKPKQAIGDNQPKTPTVGSSSSDVVVKITRNLTTPVRKPGDRGIDDGTLDREVARLGQKDPSKFVIVIPCERRNKKTGLYEPTDPAYFPYRRVEGFNWNNKTCIKSLNSWRNQVFARCLGKKGDARQSWTMKELEELLAILTEHLQTPAVANSWGLINWNEVATRFNEGLASRIFEPHELTAEVQYSTAHNRKPRGSKSTDEETTKDAQESEQVEQSEQADQAEPDVDEDEDGMMMMIAKSRPIGVTRVPIRRTPTGIKTTLLRFTDPRVTKLVSDAQGIKRMGGMRSPQKAANSEEAADSSLVNESEGVASNPSEGNAGTPVVGAGRSGPTQNNERPGHHGFDRFGDNTIIEDLELPSAAVVVRGGNAIGENLELPTARGFGARGDDTIIEDLELSAAPVAGLFFQDTQQDAKSDDDKETQAMKKRTKK